MSASGGIIRVLTGGLQAIRFARKADKAWRRMSALGMLTADEAKPQQALEVAEPKLHELNPAVAQLDPADVQGTAEVETLKAEIAKVAGTIATEEQTLLQRNQGGPGPDDRLLAADAQVGRRRAAGDLGGARAHPG